MWKLPGYQIVTFVTISIIYLINFTRKMDYFPLLQAPLFRGLTSVEIEKLMDTVPKKIRKFKAGSLVAQAGETVTSLLVVISGTMTGEMVDYSGRIIKIEDIPAPGSLAPAFIFGDKNRFPVNVISVTDSELLIIDKSDFLILLGRNEKILVNFLDMISDRSQFLSEKIKFLSFKTIKGKLAQLILQKAGEDKALIILDMTQNNLADFFGVARPSVARALGEMEEEGILEVRARRIRILDKKRLAGYMIH
jgi:cAMP-binding proteins - catabolite gene activator and regulatory subunit of cAMP-dependent protein kinases